MSNASDILGTVFKNGTAATIARVVDWLGAAIQQADVTSIVYTAYLLSYSDPDSRTPVTGHIAQTVVVNECVFDVLQTDANWTVDDEGYNFFHAPDTSSNEIFVTAGTRVLIEYTFTMASGHEIIVRTQCAII